MNLNELLSDEAFDLPVPPGAVSEVTRKAERIRRRRRVLWATPVLAAAVGLVSLTAGSGGRSNTLYGNEVRPTASPTPPPLPYQDPKAAVRMVCADRHSDNQDPYQFGLDSRLITGDPIADCARMGKINGFAVPLAAYSDGHVALVVVPAEWQLPAQFKRLPAGFRTDERRVAANLMIEDPVDGASFGDGRCLTEAQARSRARDILDSVGLDYSIRPYEDHPTQADGSTVCAWLSFPAEAGSELLLIDHDIVGEGPLDGNATPRQKFNRELRTRFTDHCLSLEQARQQVAAAATAANFARYEVVPTTVGGDRCTRVDVVDASPRVPVVLRHS